MISEQYPFFQLDTEHTSYCFRVTETGHLEHLHYGRKITSGENLTESLAIFAEKHAFAPGNTNVYDKEHPEFSLEDIRLEMSSYGKGDIREPFVEILHGDGSFTFAMKKRKLRRERRSFRRCRGLMMRMMKWSIYV